ncbi:alpha/beta fold hydrolase [Parasulfitobacter algicola]|uniref:Alpha/beta hydrolase n=1 Tax=Parasulfitobacter algicola TaxID=2614809 RepID=A0ABX2IPU9_9RHOB|nr:alpha/beta hydrolase [Sulfitobacter algicola]NSX54914.1 alpha/beta hydrolase [Sulfitobacter algicola]
MAFFTTKDGVRLYYTEDGDGLPVLCLAGLTRNGDDFQPIVDQFADQARIIRLDSRGRGRSDHTNYQTYSLAQESHDVLALLDHLGIQKVAILGTSRGGLIAMSLAITHPDRLAGVMLNDIGPVIDPGGLAVIMDYLGNRPGYKNFTEATAQLQIKQAKRFPGVNLAQWDQHARNIWVQADDGLDLRYDPLLRRAVQEQSATGTLPDLWPLYTAVTKMPHGLIRGQNSDILSAETAQKMCDLAAHTICTEVPDRGHVPFLNEPQAIAAITKWLEQMQ